MSTNFFHIFLAFNFCSGLVLLLLIADLACAKIRFHKQSICEYSILVQIVSSKNFCKDNFIDWDICILLLRRVGERGTSVISKIVLSYLIVVILSLWSNTLSFNLGLILVTCVMD